MPVERACVCLWKGLTFVLASPGGLVNACRKDLCLPVERTYDRLWKGLMITCGKDFVWFCLSGRTWRACKRALCVFCLSGRICECL